MLIKILVGSLILGLIIFLNLTSNVQGDSIYEDVATACRWLKENAGYGCDGQGERWIWTTYMRLRYSVTDCNSFCQNYRGSGSGSCTGGLNYDKSSWCPEGQTCTCH